MLIYLYKTAQNPEKESDLLKKQIILLMTDTTRKDMVGCYGNKKNVYAKFRCTGARGNSV